jgi:hypothetical protein
MNDHLNHCYQGDSKNCCFFGSSDEDCPVIVHTFTVKIPTIDTVPRAVVMETLKDHLYDFGEGEYWDETLNIATVGYVVVE